MVVITVVATGRKERVIQQYVLWIGHEQLEQFGRDPEIAGFQTEYLFGEEKPDFYGTL